MNILLDTNIIIPLEDTGKELHSSFAELRKIGMEQKHCFYIHPIQIEDVQRDKNEERKQIILSRLKQYSQIKEPPILSKEECLQLGLSQNNDNDKIDNNVLFALYRGAVHLLVTNDEGIHKKSRKIGLQDKVYRSEQFLLLLQSYSNEPISNSFTGVKEGFLYDIDKNQVFFDSLRNGYPEFDKWYQKSAADKRKCWYIENPNQQIIAIAIYKQENDTSITDDGVLIKGKILKLCTFKVDIEARGKKLGERLLYIAFDYCDKNNIDWVYLHTYGNEQQTLVGLCEEYGFYKLGKYNRDDVYIKPMKINENIENPLDFLKRYYPYFRKDNAIQKYIIPIQPRYHEDLFPDFSNLKGSLFEKDQDLYSCQGNTIKKAYLCHSKINSIKKGDIILFYRSKDRQSIQCMGIVESIFFSTKTDEVLPIIAKRTVYNVFTIENILKTKTLVILFRYIALKKEIPCQMIKSVGISGNIQSIRKISNEQYLAITNEK